MEWAEYKHHLWKLERPWTGIPQFSAVVVEARLEHNISTGWTLYSTWGNKIIFVSDDLEEAKSMGIVLISMQLT
jgi:hypothetical protein